MNTTFKRENSNYFEFNNNNLIYKKIIKIF